MVCCALLLSAGMAFAQPPQTKLAVQISAANVPPGATTQIRLTLPNPHEISYGVASFDLDPSFFGQVVAVDAFSATGDQAGSAWIQDHHVDVRFTSASGGIGRLPGLPVVSITVPVLATVAKGATGAIAFSSGATWKDVGGNLYSPVPLSARVAATGSLAIENMTPGGGMMTAGTRIRIAGTGFTAASTVLIDGGVVDSTVFISAQTIDFVLGGALDLTGKRVLVHNPDGSQADFFSDLRATPSNFATWYPKMIFPQQTYTDADVGDTDSGYALENETLQPVDVQITYFPTQKYAPGGSLTVTVPALSISAFQISGPGATVSAKSTVPIRMLAYWNRLRDCAHLRGADGAICGCSSLLEHPFRMRYASKYWRLLWPIPLLSLGRRHTGPAVHDHSDSGRPVHSDNRHFGCRIVGLSFGVARHLLCYQ